MASANPVCVVYHRRDSVNWDIQAICFTFGAADLLCRALSAADIEARMWKAELLVDDLGKLYTLGPERLEIEAGSQAARGSLARLAAGDVPSGLESSLDDL
jgi:hypothetical protein